MVVVKSQSLSIGSEGYILQMGGFTISGGLSIGTILAKKHFINIFWYIISVLVNCAVNFFRKNFCIFGLLNKINSGSATLKRKR